MSSFSKHSLSNWLSAVALSVCLVPSLDAQISVSGVEDEEFYSGSVQFEVETEEGFTYEASLNGESVAVGEELSVDRADYYELEVTRTADEDGAIETELFQFIIRADGRGRSESGLPISYILAPIPSAQEEFAGSSLRVVTIPSVPVDVEIPIVLLSTDADGTRRGVNGVVASGDKSHPDVRLFRGVGSAWIAGQSEAGSVEYSASIYDQSVSANITVEAETTWTEVSGTIDADADWGTGARVRVTDDLDVDEGVTLTIGPGSVILLGEDVEVKIDGTLDVQGTEADAILFAPVLRSAPWGGLRFEGENSSATIRGAFFTGSGADDDWFDEGGRGSTHRDEQSLFYVRDDAQVVVEECYVLDNVGQAGHGTDGFLTLRRSVVQRCVTIGQYNGGTVLVEDSALIEVPAWDSPFE
ncbi:MAG: hypothetical protein AAF517_26100, partial [Planctomycetota bacterium]